jgi:putative phosphotransacetylase
MKYQNKDTKIEVPIEISARHIHLSQQDKDVLFGVNYQFNKMRDVSQPNQYATQEVLKIKGPKNIFDSVRIVAPVRKKTQVEISITDAYVLGIKRPPVLVSGDLDNSVGGVELIGPKGSIILNKGIIVSKRHLHIQPKLAKKYGIKNRDIVSIYIDSDRSVVFNNVIVRSKLGVDKFSFQIDTDEANAAFIDAATKGYLLK